MAGRCLTGRSQTRPSDHDMENIIDGGGGVEKPILPSRGVRPNHTALTTPASTGTC